MPKTALYVTATWIALLAAVLVCGCTPYRLELGPAVAQDQDHDRDHVENLVEAVLAKHRKKADAAESPKTHGDARLTDRADGQGKAVANGAAERSGTQNGIVQQTPGMASPAGLSAGAERASPTAAYGGGPKEDSVIATLDHELQLLRAERQSLKDPRDEILHAGQQAKEGSVADGQRTRDAVDGPRRQLNDLLSRLAAHGLKGKPESTAPRLIENSLRAAKPLGPAQDNAVSNEPAANATVSDSDPPPNDRTEPLCRPAAAITTDPADPFATGKALFREADYDGALAAFSKIDSGGLSEPDRVLLRYLTATCLRKQERWEEAQAEYMAVANSEADQVLADNARWQLGTIRWRRDLENQVAKLRQLQQDGNPKSQILNQKDTQNPKSESSNRRR